MTLREFLSGPFSWIALAVPTEAEAPSIASNSASPKLLSVSAARKSLTRSS